MHRHAKQIIAMVLVLALLPLQILGSAEQIDPPQENGAVAFWVRSQFNESVTIANTVILQQEAVFSDHAELILDGGRFVIEQGAAFHGDIMLAGDGAVLEIEGVVHGNIQVTAARAQVYVAGSVDGTLTLDGLEHIRKEGTDVSVEIPESGYVKTMVLAGVGVVEARGTVELIDTDPSNKVHMDIWRGSIGTLYARSDAQFNFRENARIGTIYMDCLDRSIEDTSGLHNVCLWEASHADKIIVDGGHMHVSSGSSIDTLYIYGRGTVNMTQGNMHNDETWPTGYELQKVSLGKVFQIGRDTACWNGGYIGFHYVEDGYAANGGYTETLVAVRAYIPSMAGEDFMPDQRQVNLFSTFFDKHYGTLLSFDSTLDRMNEEAIIGQLIVDGGDLGDFRATVETIVLDANTKNLYGSVDNNAHIGTLVSTGKGNPSIRTEGIGRGVLPSGEVIGELQPRAVMAKPQTEADGGNAAGKAAVLTDGEYFVPALSGSQWFSVESDAFTALELTADVYGGYGFAVIKSPDNDWRFLDLTDGAQTVSLLNQTAGAYELRLIGAAGTEGFALRLKTEPPLRIDYTLAERAAAAEGEEPMRMDGDIRKYEVSVYNATAGQLVEEVNFDQGVIYAMPSTVSPGDMLTLSLRKKDGTIQPYTVTVTLDARRYAAVALEGTGRGHYEAKLLDIFRAHLYLYGADGTFLREIFQKDGTYTPGPLDAGTYHIAMIRAGAGGWKMLNAAGFGANGLVSGEHYLLDSFTIADGLAIRRTDVAVPDEPALQSEWLDGTGTGYQARVPSVVKGGLALMSLEWSLAREGMTDVAAEIAFMDGAVYVDGSAAIDGQVVEASWENHVLRVLLEKQSGKLLFYVESDGISDALVSNASIVFSANGQRHTQYTGSAQTRVVPLSIHGPTLFSEPSATLYGYTSPYTVAYLYDNCMQVGSALSDANGLWSARVLLSKDMRHSLTVGTGEEGVVSEPIEILRAAGAPILEYFALHYVEHGVSKKIDMEGELFGRSPIKFSYEPGTDLTFVARVSNDAYVDTVTIVAEMNGQREEIPTQRDGQSGDWVAVGQFTSDRMFAPDTFAIEYTIREEALDLMFQEPFIAVPLIDTLYATADLDGNLPLIRYYMASPSLQAADMGFGPSWFTNYSAFAASYEEDGVQRLAIWSPSGARAFTGVKGKYTEDAGYATAKIDKKGVITVTEATGATMTFDSAGRLTAVVDAYKKKTVLTYADEGGLTAVTQDKENLTLAYGTDGLIAFATSGGETVSYRYTNGHLTGVDTPNGHESYTYDSLLTNSGMHPLTCANSAEGVLRIRYDDEGMPVLLDQDGTVAEISYTSDTVTVRRDDSDTVYRLDGDGRCTRVEYGNGAYVENIIAEDGVSVRMAHADGRTAEAMYSPRMEPQWYKNENGHTLWFAYDKTGNLSGVTDQSGSETQYGYDKKGNLTRITHADGTAEHCAYGKDGSLTGYTDRSGKKAAYSYDKQGNLTRAAYPDRTSTQYNYDESGRLIAVSEGDRTVWISHNDDGGRNYGFDNGRNIYLFRDDSNAGVYAGSDTHSTNSQYENGRLTRVMGRWEEEPLVQLEYDDEDRLIRETRSNGTYTIYTYADDWLVRMENHGADDFLQSFFAYEYDGAGNIVRHETLEGVWQYAYDRIGQLTRVVSPAGVVTEYAYDPAGNRVSETVDGVTTLYEVNALNQYTRVGNTLYTYDKNGQLARKEGPEGTTDYAWDARGRLVSVNDGATRTEYGYDVFGNRDAVTVNGKTTRYTVAPTELPCVVFSDAENGETYYHYGDNGLVASEWNGERLYYSFTPLGSVSEITDAEGNVLRKYAYDAMGHVASEWAYTAEGLGELPEDALPEEVEAMEAARKRAVLAKATESDPFTYVGRYGIMDDWNGLWYMRARYTDQDVGRFVSPDPAGQTYDLNLYRYAGNDPVGFVDVTGNKMKNPMKLSLKPPTKFTPSSEPILDPASLAVSVGKNTATKGLKGAAKGDGGWDITGDIAGGIAKDFIVDKIGERLAKKAVRKGATAVVSGGLSIIVDAVELLIDVYFLIIQDHWKRMDFIINTDVMKPLTPEEWDKLRAKWESPVKSTVDPSGYVFEAVPSNHVEGVTTTVYYRDDEGRAVQWNAEEYSQQNPQITDFLGQYAWYVSTGSWKVAYEKEGYEPLETAWLPVPPPQTEVNMGLVSYSAPTVIHAALYGDGAEVTFSKYMDIDSVAQSVSLIGPGGAPIPVTVSALNPEPMAGNEERLLASRFQLAFDGNAPETAVLTVTADAVSYVGAPVKSYQADLARAWHLDGLGQQAEYLLLPHSTQQLELQASGEGHYERLSLSAAVNIGSDVTIDSVTAFDEQGRAVITVTTGEVGKATLSIAEETTGFAVAVLLAVKPDDATAEENVK